MPKKLTYEGLEQKVKEFEKEIARCKTVEELLRESEEKYRDLHENAPTAYFSVSAVDGSILRCNNAATRLLGYDKETLMGMKAFDLYADTPHGISKAQDLFKRFKKGKSIQAAELQMKNKSGHPIWISLSVEPVRDVDGNTIESRSVVIDITERKRMEDALRNSEEKYRTILESMEEGYYEVDIAGNFTLLNDSMCRILGYSKDELIRMNNRQIMDRKNTKKVYKKFNRVYTTGKPDKGTDWAVIRKSGARKIVEASISLMKDEEDRPIGFRGVVRDITNRKRMEQTLRKRKEELKIKTRDLKEVNAALRVLLKKRDEDKAQVETKVLFNMEELVKPYLEKLKKSGSDKKRKAYIDILESNLNDIISRFSYSLTSRYLSLSPAEIRVANLIKRGKITKAIAGLLDVSERTIEDHRKNIRRKLGIKNKKENLRTHLQSIGQ